MTIISKMALRRVDCQFSVTLQAREDSQIRQWSTSGIGNYFLLTFLLLGVLAEAPDLKQEERLQELESCSGVGSTSDDTEVREVSSRPSTPGLSVVSGINRTQFLFFLSS